jgi:hypothetical protein
MSKKDASWEKIFDDYDIRDHDFSESPFLITARQIKDACQDFTETGQKEVRILCKQDSRDDRPQVFIDRDLFLLPIKNGQYFIVEGEGYVDIPEINTPIKTYHSKLDYHLDTSLIGDSEMQHLDFAYASSLIRNFMDDQSLVLTIRGRKYTPEFSFMVGHQTLNTKSVQTEVDAGYEGKDKVVLIEAKNSNVKNTIIRQLFYPFRQWQTYTDKSVYTLFFEKNDDIYSIWQFAFDDVNDYNSIKLVNSSKYRIINDE